VKDAVTGTVEIKLEHRSIPAAATPKSCPVERAVTPLDQCRVWTVCITADEIVNHGVIRAVRGNRIDDTSSARTAVYGRSIERRACTLHQRRERMLPVASDGVEIVDYGEARAIRVQFEYCAKSIRTP